MNKLRWAIDLEADSPIEGEDTMVPPLKYSHTDKGMIAFGNIF